MPLLVFALGVIILVGALKKASPLKRSKTFSVSNEKKFDVLENKKGKD
jgi:hypothetical protein